MVKVFGLCVWILKEDVYVYVNKCLFGKVEVIVEGLGLLKLLEIDFVKWGEVEVVELNKINKLMVINLYCVWVYILYVIQFDEVDIIELEMFRKVEFV